MLMETQKSYDEVNKLIKNQQLKINASKTWRQKLSHHLKRFIHGFLNSYD